MTDTTLGLDLSFPFCWLQFALPWPLKEARTITQTLMPQWEITSSKNAFLTEAAVKHTRKHGWACQNSLHAWFKLTSGQCAFSNLFLLLNVACISPFSYKTPCRVMTHSLRSSSIGHVLGIICTVLYMPYSIYHVCYICHICYMFLFILYTVYMLYYACYALGFM